MQTPQVRPGLVKAGERLPRVIAYFPNSSFANLAIQLLAQIGVPNDRLGVTPPEQIEGGQGILLSVACPDDTAISRVEAICRQHGAKIHRSRG